VGALLGAPETGNDPPGEQAAALRISAQLRGLGMLFGEMIQIHDDILDTLETPATPDWTQGRLSLPILYARTADHPDRERFLSLQSRIEDQDALREAQQILVRCGAISYCAYQLIERHRHARKLLQELRLANPTPMNALWKQQLQPLLHLLKEERGPSVELDVSEELMELLR